MGSTDVFQFVPFLRGKYLFYHEYLALIGTFAILVFYIFLRVVSKITKLSKNPFIHQIRSQRLLNKPIYQNPTLSEQFVEITSTILLVLSKLILQYLLVPLSAFRIVGIWLSMIWGITIGLIGIRSLAKHMYRNNNKNSIKISQLSIFKEQSPKLYKFIAIAFMINAIAVPLLSKNTCLCFFSTEASIFPFSYLGMKDDVGLDTQFTRKVWGRKWCQDKSTACHVYTTLAEDGVTELFVNIQTEKSIKEVSVLYRIKDSKDNYKILKSTLFQFDDLESMGQRGFHVVHLKQLQENTMYEFKLDWQGYGRDQVYNFRTMPLNSTSTRSILIANGGDVGNTQPAKILWDLISAFDLDAIAIGGDIAYDDNIVDCYWTWDNLLTSYEKMSSKLGRLVPLILGLGNHDVGLNGNSYRKIYLNPKSILPMALTLFPQHTVNSGIPSITQRQPYHYHKFGGALYFALDSWYMAPYGQKQAQFIDRIIKENPNHIARFANYHVPLFSTCYNSQIDQQFLDDGIKEWIARFDKYNFQAIYENHVHAFKRTKSIKYGMEDINGTIYLGDGNWGANFHGCDINNHSLIEKTGIYNSVWLTKYDGKQIHHFALDSSGTIIDSVQQNL